MKIEKIKVYEDHIKGYGFLSDLFNNTFYGMSLEERNKYEKIWDEFEEDKSLTPHKFNNTTIPRGRLTIYGIKNEL